MAPTIFLQVASYRDPELESTLKDALINASHPNRLRFGICRQYHPEDQFATLETYRQDDRFRILDIEYSRSKGVCWARHLVQELYNGETYTLQIDSHMRFVPNWDEELIEMHQKLVERGVAKPLLTSYMPSYDPRRDPEGRILEPWRLNFDRFIPEGAVFFRPDTIPDWQILDYPIPARFYSAHFAFASGDFAIEVRHDPRYYFHGEEISIAARAYTHGYDLFHPHKVIAWHEYTRKGRSKHWDDVEDWRRLNETSHSTNRMLFEMPGSNSEYQPNYGFGTVRSLRDYEIYAGLLFKERLVHPLTLAHRDPPCPSPEEYASESSWYASFQPHYRHCIDISKSEFHTNDYSVWMLNIHCENGAVIYRRDLSADEIRTILNDSTDHVNLWVEFTPLHHPTYWSLVTHSENSGWNSPLIASLCSY